MPQKKDPIGCSVKCRSSVERVSRDPRETVEKGTATRSAAAQQSATKGRERHGDKERCSAAKRDKGDREARSKSPLLAPNILHSPLSILHFA